MVCFDRNPEYQMKDLVFGVFGLIAFAMLAGYLVVQWIKSYSWKVQKVFYGTVIEKRRYNMHSRSKRYENKEYYVVAKIDGQIMEGKCEFESYRKLNIGDEVWLFSMGTKEWYAIH